MSYDFAMTVDAGEEYRSVLRDFDDLNYTYNVSPMYRAAFPGEKGVNMLHGLTGEEAQEFLVSAIQKMRDDPNYYKEMNPSNGWGNYEGALRVLETLLVWCKDVPKAIMEIG